VLLVQFELYDFNKVFKEKLLLALQIFTYPGSKFSFIWKLFGFVISSQMHRPKVFYPLNGGGSYDDW